ncbi:MAG TPA: hypothetical protein VFO16_07060, partial [Pseudonocardiaceae bacterium]|nr:hypothetical protein [Pseudonocardiaceae bacterium]
MARASLTGTDLYHWIALRRVFDGEVVKLGRCWRDHGHRVPGYVTEALDELLTGGLVTLTDPGPMAEGSALAALTSSGTVRFEQLCQRAGIPSGGELGEMFVEDAEGAGADRAGRDSAESAQAGGTG